MRIASHSRWAVLVALLMVSACRSDSGERGNESGNTDTTAMVQPVTMGETEADQLLLFERLPLGLTYEDVSSRLDTVSLLQPTGIDGLERASTRTQVLGEPAMLEFNFEQDVLYSYYFQASVTDCERTRDLSDRIQRFYTGRFGQPRTEDLDEGAYRAQNAYWPADSTHIVLTLGSQSGSCRLAWGFQEQQP